MSEEEAQKATGLYSDPVLMMHDFTNYQNYTENVAAAEATLADEFTQGFFRWHSLRARLEEEVGQSVPSRVGVIVKENDGNRPT